MRSQLNVILEGGRYSLSFNLKGAWATVVPRRAPLQSQPPHSKSGWESKSGREESKSGREAEGPASGPGTAGNSVGIPEKKLGEKNSEFGGDVHGVLLP